MDDERWNWYGWYGWNEYLKAPTRSDEACLALRKWQAWSGRIEGVSWMDLSCPYSSEKGICEISADIEVKD